MTNHLAIATVTAALKTRLQDVVQTVVPGATVTTLRPNRVVDQEHSASVNLFLFQVSEATGWRNADLPTRDRDGTVMQRPVIALALDYVLSFYGDDARYVPQLLLAGVVSAMHSQPILTAAEIAATIVSAGDALAGSTLADQVDRVRLTMQSLTIEELSRLWSVFLQTPYALSVVYQASVVLIESDVPVESVQEVKRQAITVQRLTHPTAKKTPTDSEGNTHQ
jgi:hypothetical protein